MKDLTLKEKINNVIFWASFFFVVYLIVGFLIKSEWLSKTDQLWSFSYELLRDALTLTAYFLASLTAIVLFTDWRVQHKAINNENEVIETLKSIKEFDTQLQRITFDLDHESDIADEIIMKAHLEKLKLLEENVSVIRMRMVYIRDSFNDVSFITKSEDALGKQSFLIFFAKNYITVNNNANFDNSPENQTNRINSYGVFSDQRNAYSIEMSELFKELTKLAKPYRIV